MNQKGNSFSIDFLVGFFVVVFSLIFVETHFLHSFSEKKTVLLWREASLLSDQLVENDSLHVPFGLALYDPLLHRVQSHHTAFLPPVSLSLPHASFILVSVSSKSDSFSFGLRHENDSCITVQRAVLLEEKPALLEVMACG